jgi:hypothetical protein
MLGNRTPRYLGRNQRCADASPGLTSWLAALVGALAPKTPDYARAPWDENPDHLIDASASMAASERPPSGGNHEAPRLEHDPIARVLQALFGPRQ